MNIVDQWGGATPKAAVDGKLLNRFGLDVEIDSDDADIGKAGPT
jgi:hypothetical protein